ncbi:hypothetical protein [Streptomyces caniscabiei]|uniref:hypothetical protein n=1 Tax=Streptomyces caniscabiei TaxID=2746961 RepID=UPI000A3CE02D|nr:hypothetical protein [Streptomyces caniscabiei]
MADGDGLRVVPRGRPFEAKQARLSSDAPDLAKAVQFRGLVSGAVQYLLDLGEGSPNNVDSFAAKVLVVPSSDRWQEAISTALLGDWCDSLLHTGHLPATALGALRAEARAVHRQLMPVWRRRTRHGRVLSLDAALDDGLSLHDLVAADAHLLARVAGGVFEDERLNAVLRSLAPAERAVVFAKAEVQGTTWTEAAAVAGVADAAAFGERVRRKTKRLAAEQRRRAAQLRASG